MFPTASLPSSGMAGPLYHKDDMPEHFHEHFIVTGYRHPKSSAKQVNSALIFCSGLHF
jgi:hypothetical protein